MYIFRKFWAKIYWSLIFLNCCHRCWTLRKYSCFIFKSIIEKQNPTTCMRSELGNQTLIVRFINLFVQIIELVFPLNRFLQKSNWTYAQLWMVSNQLSTIFTPNPFNDMYLKIYADLNWWIQNILSMDIPMQVESRFLECLETWLYEWGVVYSIIYLFVRTNNKNSQMIN